MKHAKARYKYKQNWQDSENGCLVKQPGFEIVKLTLRWLQSVEVKAPGGCTFEEKTRYIVYLLKKLFFGSLMF